MEPGQLNEIKIIPITLNITLKNMHDKQIIVIKRCANY